MQRSWIVCGIAVSMFVTLTSEIGLRSAAADDWPMLGRDGRRNSVSTERGAPTEWSVKQVEDGRVIRESSGIRWSAALGSQTHSSPVVSGGLVWIGTNRDQEPGAGTSVLKCFRVTDGKQVYEYLSPQLLPRIHDAGWTGLGSSPLIEGDHLWLTTNRSEVLCLDIGPLLRGEGLPSEKWKLDMVKTFDTSPYAPVMGPPRPCSIGPSWNGRIFVTTNNGLGDDYKTVSKPDAPSLVCLNKETGEVFWTDNSPGPNILTTQFSSPTVVEIRGQVQVIVPQGDGWVRAFDPVTGAKLWEFDVNPKEALYSYGRSTRNSLLGNAVVYEDRVYLASGRDVEQGEGAGRLVCIDPTKRGDISSELAVDANDQPLPRRRVQAVDPTAGENAISNPNSALIWEFVSCGKPYEDNMHRTMGSVVIAKGLVIVADIAGLVHCFDAKTGKRHWRHDMFATVWGSPLVVDDNVYVADEDGDVEIFGLSADPNIALRHVNSEYQPQRTINMADSIYSSPVFANGVLYLATRTQLFAIAREKNETDSNLTGGYWPQWRGPNRDNVSSETGLLKEWPVGGPPLRWRVDGIGGGIASVSIADGKIYTLGNFYGAEYLSAFDQRTGSRAWAALLGPGVNENPLMRWLSQRSPTLDGDRLYAITTRGRLVCLQTRDGQEVWSKNYPEDYASLRPTWGFCDYPLVDSDRLICTPGGPQASVVALDKLTGKEVWRSAVPDGGRASYAALVVTTVDGVRQYVAFIEKGLVGLRASDGKLLWNYDRITNRTANSHTPIVRGNQLLAGNGFGAGTALLQLAVQDENVSVQELSHQNYGVDAFQDTSLVIGDYQYAAAGSAVICIDWKNAKKVWFQRPGATGQGRTAVLYAESHLYLRNSDGTVSLVEPSPSTYIEHGRFQIPDAVNAAGATAPVIANRCLYLRDDNKLLCYDLSEEALKDPITTRPTIELPIPVGALVNEVRERTLRSVYVPTPQDIVEKMLKLAAIQKSDVIYDLGSGDGRIVITAARKFECHAVGYELDKELVESSRAKAKEANLEELVTIEHKDLFTADLSKADVVMVYLLPAQLEKLTLQLTTMRPGARLVSHQFEIPDYPADLIVKPESMDDGTIHSLYFWTLPLKKKIKIENE